MKQIKLVGWAIAVILGLQGGFAFAAETCFTAIDAIAVSSDEAGNLQLSVYSKEVINLVQPGSTYLYYKGINEVAKVFQAQFLTAKATGTKVCVQYSSGSPEYALVISMVAAANPEGWPFQ